MDPLREVLIFGSGLALGAMWTLVRCGRLVRRMKNEVRGITNYLRAIKLKDS